MATRLLGSQRSYEGSRDAEGHRTYKITFVVEGTPGLDGPANVMRTPGLPIPGSLWNVSGDTDLDAWAQQEMEVEPLGARDGEKPKYWLAHMTFSTKPPDRDKQRCQDQKIEDPLLEPAKISGGFQRVSREIVRDRFGRLVSNSAHEQIRGKEIEFDESQPTVKIEQNVLQLNLPLLTAMRDTVNDRPLWGLPRRTILLNNISWERQFYGLCYLYYKRTLEFNVSFNTSGWDREILDEGTKVLSGHWHPTNGEWVLDNVNGAAPDPNNPRHFIRFTDRKGNPIRGILNGQGQPAGVVVGNTGNIYVSIANSNTGNSLSNGTKWVAWTPSDGVEATAEGGASFASPSNDVQEWADDQFYPRGRLVTTGGLTAFIALQANDGLDPDDVANAAFWSSLTAVVSKGNYSAAITYNSGDWVVDAGRTTAAGRIRVEKYGESNFLLLGIPTVF